MNYLEEYTKENKQKVLEEAYRGKKPNRYSQTTGVMIYWIKSKISFKGTETIYPASIARSTGGI